MLPSRVRRPHGSSLLACSTDLSCRCERPAHEPGHRRIRGLFRTRGQNQVVSLIAVSAGRQHLWLAGCPGLWPGEIGGQDRVNIADALIELALGEVARALQT